LITPFSITYSPIVAVRNGKGHREAGSLNGGAEPAVRVSDLGFTEGPVDLRDGTVAFTSMTRGQVLRLSPSGVDVLVDTGAGPTGLALSADGALVVAQNSGFWGAPAHAPAGLFVARHGTTTALRTDVGAPNDLCFGADGRLFFTDPVSPAALESAVRGHVYAYAIDYDELECLDDAMHFPNGLAFDQTGTRLYVAESFERRINILDLDGDTVTRHEWALVDGGLPDGLCVDDDGRVYAAVGATDSIHVFSPDGAEIDRIHLGAGAYPSNCCFAGDRLERLVVTAAGLGALIDIDVRVRGLPLYPFR
jgi:gluconolactonase